MLQQVSILHNRKIPSPSKHYISRFLYVGAQWKYIYIYYIDAVANRAVDKMHQRNVFYVCVTLSIIIIIILYVYIQLYAFVSWLIKFTCYFNATPWFNHINLRLASLCKHIEISENYVCECVRRTEHIRLKREREIVRNRRWSERYDTAKVKSSQVKLSQRQDDFALYTMHSASAAAFSI